VSIYHVVFATIGNTPLQALQIAYHVINIVVRVFSA
jgi:hypothetical protein